MNRRSILTNSVLLTALVAGAFTANLDAQSLTAEKTGVVGAYVRDRDDVAGLNRQPVGRAANGNPAATVKPASERVLELERQAFALINKKRAETGLTPLAWSDEVAKVARLHSENMVKFNFFSHRGVDGKMVDGRADSLGVTKWTAMGENIAYNRGFKNPIETAVEKWMLSPGHRENLLSDRWRESAVGIAVTDDGTFYFTQVFLKRK